MRIALPTCRDLPDWEIDDQPLFDALADRGVSVEHPIWDDLAVDWSVYDAVLVRTVWDYQEKLPAFIEWIERVDGETRLFNPAEVLIWNTDKRYLRELELAGIRIAPTVWLTAGSTVDLGALLAERGWTRGFVKPLVGATARETLRFDTSERGLELAQAHVDRLLPDEGLILQPYLASVETVGELSLIFIDGQLSHAVRKLPVPGDYRVQDDFGGTDAPVEVDEATLALGRAALLAGTPEAHRPLLYGRVDFMTGDEGDLLLGELEIIEPSLFFRHAPQAAGRLADALLRRVSAP